jgi:deoxycytidine triphosphate deaminase
MADEIPDERGARDPFPQIPAALLNSAHIQDYVHVTGMIAPFDPSDLKPASYAFRLRGTCVRYEGDMKIVDEVGDGKPYRLPKNSIAFVTVGPRLTLPDYIAARFNLRIDLVYRGLLLGTGPLIDPGWFGDLSIPLHNLTDQDYMLTGGERLIWMEFTKTSPIPGSRYAPRQFSMSQPSDFIPYPEANKDSTDNVHKRLERALRPTASTHVMSSLSSALGEARASVLAAEEKATRAEAAVKSVADKALWWQAMTAGVSAVVGVVVTAAVAWSAFQLATGIHEDAVRVVARQETDTFLRNNLYVDDRTRDAVVAELALLKSQYASDGQTAVELRQQISELQSRLEALEHK